MRGEILQTDYISRSMWITLSALKFFLSIVVLCAHLTVAVPADDIFYLAGGSLGPVTAVYGFLIASGFSIAASIERSSEGFHRRRWLRIVPLYWLSILFSTFLMLYGEGGITLSFAFLEYPDLKSILANAFFLQGLFVVGDNFRINAVIWAIAVEAFFYTIALLLFKFRKSIVLKALTFASFFFFCSYSWYNLPYYGVTNHGLAIAALGWWWMMGFWFWFNREKEIAQFALVLIGFIALSLNSAYSRQFDAVTYAIICLALCYGDRVQWKFKNLISALGAISYPLYLFHWPILIILNKSGITNGFTAILVCLSAALFLDRYFDKPIQRALKGNRK